MCGKAYIPTTSFAKVFDMLAQTLKIRVPLLNHREQIFTHLFCSPVHHLSAIYVLSNVTLIFVASRPLWRSETGVVESQIDDRFQPRSEFLTNLSH